MLSCYTKQNKCLKKINQLTYLIAEKTKNADI